VSGVCSFWSGAMIAAVDLLPRDLSGGFEAVDILPGLKDGACAPNLVSTSGARPGADRGREAGQPPRRRTRAPNEHGFAALKTWRIRTRLRLNPARATVLLRGWAL
jgi:hypothetical protein